MLLVTTVLSGLAQYHWSADLLANLRVQQILACSVLILVFLLFRQWRWSGAALLMITFHLSWLGDALPRQTDAAYRGAGFRVMIANVFTSNDRHQEILDDVSGQQADVIVILELSMSLADRLAAELGQSHPHQILRPQDRGNFGIGLFSAHPINDSSVFAVDQSIPIETIEASIGEYRVWATHPLPPVRARGFAARNRHLKLLAERIQSFRSQQPQTPIVLVGDMNVTPWSPWFRKFAQQSGLRRGIDGINLTPTWYVFDWFPFGLVLDHAMISSDVQCTGHRVGPEFGSDHRSVTVDLATSQ